LRDEFDNMQAPKLGGAVVPHGDGKTQIRMRRGSSLADFAEKINADPAALVAALFHLGEMVTATQSVDADTFEILGAQLGYVIEVVSPEDEDRELLQDFDIDLARELEALDPSELVARPPVVTVMGHVDHGKTSLLDAIRKTEVFKSEAGGITQHIGAYQIHHDHEGINRAITFIDTPGHEAFTAMRARGAKVTDIAVLVVAADDGIMPQTIEALNHAQAADVPIVVAVNKIDKEGANPDKVRQQLTEYNLVAEEYGGETIFVNVSAKAGQGIDALIESILLTADAAIDLRAVANDDARGVAIEAHLDRGRGPVEQCWFNAEHFVLVMPSLQVVHLVVFEQCSMKMVRALKKPVHHAQYRFLDLHLCQAREIPSSLPMKIALRARLLKNVKRQNVTPNLRRLARRFHLKTSWSNPRFLLLTSSSRVTFRVLLKPSKMHSCNSMLALKLIFALFTVVLAQSQRAISLWHLPQLQL